MDTYLKVVLSTSVLVVAVLGTLAGGFWALVLQMIAITAVSTATFRRAQPAKDVARWQESRLSVLASILAALVATGVLVATFYSLVRVLSSWLFEPAIRLVLVGLVSGPFFPLLRRRLPAATVTSSTIYGVMLFVIQLIVWPYPKGIIPSLGFYYLFLLWIEYGLSLGLVLTYEGIHAQGLPTRNRIFHEFITLWCVLLVSVFVILRYRILPIALP